MSNLAIAPYNLAGQVFSACNQAGATVTLINTSTATGFILSNTFGSARKIILLNLSFTYTTVPTATAVVFLAMSVAPTPTQVVHTTPVTIYGADGSGATTACAARVDSSATTPNLPVYTRALGYSPTTPATTGLGTLQYTGEGDIVLVPGSWLQVSYITTAPVGITNATWIEVPFV